MRSKPFSAQHQGNLVAKPNYQFEKRQRDLAKKSKQEEKRQQKLANKAAGIENEPALETPEADTTVSGAAVIPA